MFVFFVGQIVVCKEINHSAFGNRSHFVCVPSYIARYYDSATGGIFCRVLKIK